MPSRRCGVLATSWYKMANRRQGDLPAHAPWRFGPVVGSLHGRLLAVTVAGVALALLVAGVALTAMFRDHVVSQFQAAMERQLDQLLVELEFDEAGNPRIDAAAMFDPRLQKPYSGLYWQVDELSPGKTARVGVLRSRSLWDATLTVPLMTASPDGRVEIVQARGPAGESLLVIERVVTAAEVPDRTFRLLVAGDLRFNLEATWRFGGMLAAALSVLFILLGLAAWMQVSVGLRPLRDLQRALKAVREGQVGQLQGVFPQEVQPLVDDFNQVLTVNEDMLQRARTQAGNLAHALKTPLAVLENEAGRALRERQGVAAEVLQEQLGELHRHVNWHLMRARAAAAKGIPGHSTDVAATLSGLLRVLQRVFVDKSIDFELSVTEPSPAFAGEAQDLQEILGNLLENACKWTASSVSIRVADAGSRMLQVSITDDGPGIDPAHLSIVSGRGVRLDEKTPGSGLGLAIVQELVALYEGRVEIANVASGQGLSVTVWLPGAPQN